MQKIDLEGTPKTPEVHLDGEAGKLMLGGRSIPENSVDFYSSIMNWLDEYGRDPQASTVMDVKLEYFNTSSSKCILDIFKKLEAMKKAGKDVQVNWYYEEDDEDMMEAGEDYDAIIDIPFEMKEVDRF